MTTEAQPTSNAPWFEIAKAEARANVKEAPGAANNPRVVTYHLYTTLKATEDSVPWCSAFANFCMFRSGHMGTRSAAARSWLKWGDALKEPKPGCVVVFWRGKPTTADGHVAFYVGESVNPHNIDVLGGNQGDRVCVAPYAKERVLGYRWPAEVKP